MRSLALITGAASYIWHIRELFGEFGALWKPYQRYYRFSDCYCGHSTLHA